MNNMNLNQLFTLLNLNGQKVVSFDANNPVGVVVFTLESGATLTYAPASVPAPAPIHTHDVAYFVYPSSDGGMPLHRRVIVYDGGRERTTILRGYETSNDANYQFKAFRVSRMRGLRIVPEVITAEDRVNLMQP